MPKPKKQIELNKLFDVEKPTKDFYRIKKIKELNDTLTYHKIELASNATVQTFINSAKLEAYKDISDLLNSVIEFRKSSNPSEYNGSSSKKYIKYLLSSMIKLQQKIYENNDDKVTRDLIANALKYSQESIRQRLVTLEKKGFIKKENISYFDLQFLNSHVDMESQKALGGGNFGNVYKYQSQKDSRGANALLDLNLIDLEQKEKEKEKKPKSIAIKFLKPDEELYEALAKLCESKEKIEIIKADFEREGTTGVKLMNAEQKEKKHYCFNHCVYGRIDRQAVILSRFEPKGTIVNFLNELNAAEDLEPTGIDRGFLLSSMFNNLWETINFIHKQNILHLDISARNILVNENNQAVLADFGLAQEMQENGTVNITGRSQNPLKWMDKFSLLRTATRNSDYYALKVTMLEMMAAASGLDHLKIFGQIRLDQFAQDHVNTSDTKVLEKLSTVLKTHLEEGLNKNPPDKKCQEVMPVYKAFENFILSKHFKEDIGIDLTKPLDIDVTNSLKIDKLQFEAAQKEFKRLHKEAQIEAKKESKSSTATIHQHFGTQPSPVQVQQSHPTQAPYDPVQRPPQAPNAAPPQSSEEPSLRPKK